MTFTIRRIGFTALPCLALVACQGRPVNQVMTLAQAHLPRASALAFQGGSPAEANGTLMLPIAAPSYDCPVLSSAVATLDGAPLTAVTLGGVDPYYRGCGSSDINPEGGLCPSPATCDPPTWSWQGRPDAGARFVVQDSSATLELDVGDFQTVRTIQVISVTDGAGDAGGEIVFAWEPASDADGGLQVQAAFDFDNDAGTLRWNLASGDQVTLAADTAASGSSAPPDGGSGTLSAAADVPIPVSRCDWTACDAMISAFPETPATWRPW